MPTSGPRSTPARWTTCSTCRSGSRARSSRRCEITLSPPEDREIAERPIADLRAFEYYQRARQEYYRYTAEGMAAARALAEHGLAVVGPNEALYGMLGTVYAWSPTVLLGGDEETTLREAEACARRAFELNPELGAGPVDHGAGRLSPGQRGRGGSAAGPGLRRRPQQSRRDAPAGRGVPAGRADRPDAGGADPAGRAGPADGQQSLPAGAELVAGRRRRRRRCPRTGGRSSWIRGAPSAGSAPASRWWPRGARPRRRSSSSGWSASLRTITWRRWRCASGAGSDRRPGGGAVAAERGGARDGGVGRVLVVPDGRRRTRWSARRTRRWAGWSMR